MRLVMRLHALERVPDRVREILDDERFWYGVLFVGMVLALGLSIQSVRTTTRTTARETAARVAQAQSLAASTYETCMRSISSRTLINAQFVGVQKLADALVTNSALNVANLTPSSPLYSQQVGKYERLLKADARIAAAKLLHVPSADECSARRIALLRG